MVMESYGVYCWFTFLLVLIYTVNMSQNTLSGICLVAEGTAAPALIIIDSDRVSLDLQFPVWP